MWLPSCPLSTGLAEPRNVILVPKHLPIFRNMGASFETVPAEPDLLTLDLCVDF
jgi:hypothetical protein